MPDWRDEIIYQLLVDRFNDADSGNNTIGQVTVEPGDLARHQGGDWRGVTERLDYIQRLGATAIWISPLVKNVDRTELMDGYHGYWASDFTEVNPRFGSLQDLQNLVDEAHARGIKVIADIVTNHAGRVFYYDLNENGSLDPGEMEPPFSEEGPYDAPIVWTEAAPRLWSSGDAISMGPEHFHRRGQTTIFDQRQKELGDFPTGLRDLDSENEAVLSALIETYARWVERTGVDGFRLDAVPHMPHEFWRRFCAGLRERLELLGKRRFMLLGEVFDPDPQTLAGYTDEGGLDSVFDFTLKAALINEVILDGAPTELARIALEQSSALYPAQPHERGLSIAPYAARVAFADNHDVRRVGGELADPRVVTLAMVTVFTVDAIPAVYYGTEQGFTGRDGHASREPLWPSGFSEETPEFRLIARLSQLRKRSAALRRGRLQVRYSSEIAGLERGAGAGLLVWTRGEDSDPESLVIAINAHAHDESWAKVQTGHPNATLRDVLYDRPFEVETDERGEAFLTLPPRSAVILHRD